MLNAITTHGGNFTVQVAPVSFGSSGRTNTDDRMQIRIEIIGLVTEVNLGILLQWTVEFPTYEGRQKRAEAFVDEERRQSSTQKANFTTRLPQYPTHVRFRNF